MGFAVPEPEERWHHYVLVIILVTAACARFYSVDLVSLSSFELLNLNACAIPNWLDMADQYRSHTGMPPLYPTLLCQAIDLLGNPELIARSVSIICGLCSIYMFYILGRDIFSPTTGLLVAAIMAVEFKSLIIDRSATPYALLALCLIVHHYCFCKLFICDSTGSAPVTLDYAGKNHEFHWRWQPHFPGQGKYLLGFWCSAALAFYTSPMALILLFSEMATVIWLMRNQAIRREQFRHIWLPVLVMSAPWLPVLYGYKSWSLEGNLLTLPTPAVIAQQMMPLFPINPVYRISLLVLSVTWLLFHIAALLRKTLTQEQVRYSHYSIVLAFVAVLSLGMIKVAAHLSYIFYWWAFILLLVTPIAWCIQHVTQPRMQKWIVIAVVMLTIIFQVKSNASYKYYQRRGDGDFRLAANIVRNDADFMNSDRVVYISSPVFSFYLDKSGVASSNLRTIDKDTAPSPAQLVLRNTGFYYLEHFPYDMEAQQASTSFKTLAGKFRIVCTTSLPWIHIFRFASEPPTASDPAVIDCRDYTIDPGVLK